jgi:hypothetical protein
VVVANDDIPDRQAGLPLVSGRAENPTPPVLVARPRRLARQRAVSVEHEIPDAHVVRVAYEQHAEGGDVRLRQEYRGRSRAKDGRVGTKLDGVSDDERARREKQNAAARSIDGVTRVADRVEVVHLVLAVRAEATDVEYPLGRQLHRLVLDDDVIDHEVIDVAVRAATRVARFHMQDVPRCPQTMVTFDEEHIAVPAISGRAYGESAEHLNAVHLKNVPCMADIARLKQEKSGVIWIDLRAIEHKVLCRTDEGNVRLDIVEGAWLVAEVLALELNDGEIAPHVWAPPARHPFVDAVHASCHRRRRSSSHGRVRDRDTDNPAPRNRCCEKSSAPDVVDQLVDGLQAVCLPFLNDDVLLDTIELVGQEPKA